RRHAAREQDGPDHRAAGAAPGAPVVRWVPLLVACSSPPPPPPLSQHVPAAPPSRCADTYSSLADDAPTQLAYRISTTTVAERTLVRHRNDFNRCIARDPHVRGTVTITFSMSGGQLKDVHTRGFDPVIDRCVCDVLFAIDFPRVD